MMMNSKMVDMRDYKLYLGDCLEIMRGLDRVDAVITSPPYDNLREYENKSEWSFEIFKPIARELYRVVKDGGVVVWVVGDATVNGSETGTSFKQALYFMECGFRLHDTMIYNRASPHPPNVRYYQDFEYMFIFSKGKPKVFNPLTQPKKPGSNERMKRKYNSHTRGKDGKLQGHNQVAHKRLSNASKTNERVKSNVWIIRAGGGVSTTDKYAFEHPAIFPEKLAKDHIVSWTNPGDIVLDPFMGAGTTGKCCAQLKRKFIGIEIAEKYYKISERRVGDAYAQGVMF
jgi:DNA modification methylase